MDQIKECRFAGAAFANQGNALALFNIQLELAENRYTVIANGFLAKLQQRHKSNRLYSISQLITLIDQTDFLCRVFDRRIVRVLGGDKAIPRERFQ